MLRKLLFLILLISVLGACSQQETGQVSNGLKGSNVQNSQNKDQKSIISLEEVERSIQDQGIELIETDFPENNFFTQELKGVSPKAYSLKEATLSIYVFQSVDDRKAGMEQFGKNHGNVKLVPYETFTIQNVLVFYVQGEEEMHNKLSSALNELK